MLSQQESRRLFACGFDRDNLSAGTEVARKMIHDIGVCKFILGAMRSYCPCCNSYKLRTNTECAHVWSWFLAGINAKVNKHLPSQLLSRTSAMKTRYNPSWVEHAVAFISRQYRCFGHCSVWVIFLDGTAIFCFRLSLRPTVQHEGCHIRICLVDRN